MTVIKPLLLLNALAILTRAQQLFCHISGECTGGIFVGSSDTESYNQCQDLCNTNINCRWFSFLGTTKACLQFYDCPKIENTCTNCYTGEAECPAYEPMCDAVGFCTGEAITSSTVEAVEDCLKFCQSVPECNWYSYFTNTKECFLTEDCDALDDTCSNCLTGERECQVDPGNTVYSTLFVIGGDPTAARGEVEVLDLNTTTTTCPSVANYSKAWYGSVGTYMEDTGIMVCGGQDGDFYKDQCNIYIPERDIWLPTYSMQWFRSQAAAIQLSPTQWWITGGNGNGAQSTNSEVFTVGEGFSMYVDLPAELYAHNLVRVDESHIMLLGGRVASNTAWLFNTDTERWNRLPAMPIAVSHTQAGLITHEDGSLEVVVVAGRSSGGATQIYSMTSNSWRLGLYFVDSMQLEDAASVQRGNTFMVVGGYHFYTVGGFLMGEYLDTIYEYQVETEEWVLLPQRLSREKSLLNTILVPDELLNCA